MSSLLYLLHKHVSPYKEKGISHFIQMEQLQTFVGYCRVFEEQLQHSNI